jgi:hypothetical protein
MWLPVVSEWLRDFRAGIPVKLAYWAMGFGLLTGGG